jgi:hypothetical protein
MSTPLRTPFSLRWIAIVIATAIAILLWAFSWPWFVH